jgi:hypothetical protein
VYTGLVLSSASHAPALRDLIVDGVDWAGA